MENLPSNSHRQHREQKDEPKKLNKIVKGEVVTRKRPLASRMRETLFAGRADVVSEYVFWDVLIPSAKDTIIDAGITFLERMFRGEGYTSRTRSNVPGQSRGTYGNQTNYRAAFQGQQPNQTPVGLSRQDRAQHNFQQLIIPTRPEAEAIIDALYGRIAEYNAVTVADLYDLCGVPVNYTDDKYGWTDIQGAGIIRIGGGFTLDLPRPEPLD